MARLKIQDVAAPWGLLWCDFREQRTHCTTVVFCFSKLSKIKVSSIWSQSLLFQACIIAISSSTIHPLGSILLVLYRDFEAFLHCHTWFGPKCVEFPARRPANTSAVAVEDNNKHDLISTIGISRIVVTCDTLWALSHSWNTCPRRI